jgi:endonuclease/exonuclease/phosphatase family metal-dependent hydrolase
MIAFSNEFKIASYNVENLFDLQKNGSEYREYLPHRNGWDSAALDKKLNNIAQVICEVNADVIALQEIENINALNLLKRRLKRVGCEYRYHAIASKQRSVVKVALLSKFKITKTHEIQVDHSHTSRSILEARVDLEGKELIVFANHWKSKHSYGTESKRVRYAKALMRAIEKLPPQSEYIILGDFNSNYNEYYTIEDKFNDTNGRTGINHTLKTFVNNRLVDIATLQATPQDILHYNLWLEYPKHNRWSQSFYGKKGSVDSIIIPQSMLNQKDIEYKIDSFGVFRAPYLFKERGYINRWELKYHKHTKRGYSDHLPIYATFSIGKSNTPAVSNSRSTKITKPTKDSIEKLYTIESIDKPIRLKNVKVIFKRRDVAIIKQTPNGRGMYIFRETSKLQEGKRYDMDIERIEEYKGLQEITKISNIKPLGDFDTQEYIRDAAKGFDIKQIKQNELYSNIVGIYKNRKLYINNQKIDIFFKDKNAIPPNGSKIKIDFGHIGYYYQKQIVIYDGDDYRQLER